MMNKLPLNWSECKLEDVLEYEQPTKYIVSNTNYSDSGIPVLTAGKSFLLGYTNDTTGVFNKSELPIIIFDDFTTATKLVDFPFKVKSSAMKILHANKNVNILYFYYLMQTIHYKADTHKRYWISEYAKQEVKLPPLAEQGRIVDRIYEIFAKIDAGVEKLKSAQEKIKQYKQSVLHSAFTGKLYKTTEWKELPLKDVCSINPKTEIPELKEEDIVAFLPMPAVDAETNKYDEVYAQFKSVKKGFTKFQNKDVLFAKITPCMENGKSCVVDNLLHNIGFGSTEFHILRCSENLLNKFIYFIISSVSFRKLAKMKMTGAVGQQRVPADFLKTYTISLPTLPEQERIVEEIEKRFAKADKMLEVVEKSLKSAEQLKQSVLKKAFEGKLVPQDPNDEPASVLLERIKSEKQQNEKAKGKRNDRK